MNGWDGSGAPVPPEPAAVAEYERIAEKGGLHTEGGWVLLIGAGVGVAYAAWQGRTAGYAALLLVPLAVWVWIAGHRLGRRQRETEAVAREYVRALMAAKARGADVPELSAQLSRLL
ncbi:hypothetical protein [Streptomyces mobaraensis]|uniref:hypothetical protein n=1 Tax=Streptomyces mobaraensis TaxID=35621 RepID=UPI0033F008CB